MKRIITSFLVCAAFCPVARTQPPYERELGVTIVSHGNDGYQYGRVPANQFGTSIALGAEVLNSGTEPQTNLVLHISMVAPGPANSIETTQGHALLPAATGVVLGQQPAITAMVEGDHSIVYWVTSDQDVLETQTANDSAVRHIRVDNDWFSMDGIGVHVPSNLDTVSIGTDTYPGGENQMTCMTMFRVAAPLRVLGMEILLGNGTSPGGYMVGALYDTTEALAGDLSLPLWESNPEDIGPLEIGMGSRYILVDDLILDPGAYYAAATLYSDDGTSPLRITDDRTVQQPLDASLVHVPGLGTMMDGNAFAIRLHVDMVNAVDDPAGPVAFTLHPNPTDGLITFRGDQHHACSIEIWDPTGRSVHSSRVTGGDPIDLRAETKGLYLVRVTTAGSTTVRQIVLE